MAELMQSKKASQWHCGIKTHKGVDAGLCQLHTVRGTSGGVIAKVEANSLLHNKANVAFGDAGYQGPEKRPEADDDLTLPTARRHTSRKRIANEGKLGVLIAKINHLKVSIRRLHAHACSLRMTRSRLRVLDRRIFPLCVIAA